VSGHVVAELRDIRDKITHLLDSLHQSSAQVLLSVSDPKRIFPDPDPTFQVMDPDPGQNQILKEHIKIFFIHDSEMLRI